VVNLKLQPSHNGPRTRRLRRETRRAGGGRVGITSTNSRSTDVSETAGREAGHRISRLRRERVRDRRRVDPGPIEDVRELGAKHQADSLAHPESTAQTHALIWPALLTEVAVVRVRSTEVTFRRIAPRFWIQHERPSWIVTTAVDVELLIGVSFTLFIDPRCGEQGLAGYAFY